MDIPTVTAAEMREVDRAARRAYGISPDWLVEHAGYQVAAHVRDEHVPADRIHVYCGSGNNGADGMVAARRLAAWGFDVLAIPASRNLSGLPAEQFWALERSDASIAHDPSGDPDVIIDTVNEAWTDVVAVDVPSGVHPDTGEPFKPHVDADATVTLGLPKQGVVDCEAAGTLVLADIGLPPGIYDRVGLDRPQPFSRSSRIVLSDE